MGPLRVGGDHVEEPQPGPILVCQYLFSAFVSFAFLPLVFTLLPLHVAVMLPVSGALSPLFPSGGLVKRMLFILGTVKRPT